MSPARVWVERSGRSSVYYPETGYWAPQDPLGPVGQLYLGSWRFCWSLVALALAHAAVINELVLPSAPTVPVTEP